MKPQELGCFEQVKAVLGEHGAIEELQKVIDCEDYTSVLWDQDEELGLAFDWEATPQGSIFWMDVCDDKVPDGYKPPSDNKDIIEPAGITPEQMDEIKEFIVKELNAKLDRAYQLAQHITEGTKVANDDVFEEPEIVPWEPFGGEWNIEPEMVFAGGPYDSYCDFGLARCSREQAEKARDEMRVFNRLLAYRDEFDPDFDFEESGGGWTVYHNGYKYESYGDDLYSRNVGTVYMSEGAAEDLADKLNSGEVVL